MSDTLAVPQRLQDSPVAIPNEEVTAQVGWLELYFSSSLAEVIPTQLCPSGTVVTSKLVYIDC